MNPKRICNIMENIDNLEPSPKLPHYSGVIPYENYKVTRAIMETVGSNKFKIHITQQKIP